MKLTCSAADKRKQRVLYINSSAVALGLLAMLPAAHAMHHGITAPGLPGQRGLGGRWLGAPARPRFCSANVACCNASLSAARAWRFYCAVQAYCWRCRGDARLRSQLQLVAVHRPRQRHDGRLALAHDAQRPPQASPGGLRQHGREGKSRVSSGLRVAMGSPNRSTQPLPQRACAAATVICCPSTARTASSKPSKAPGTRHRPRENWRAARH